MPAKSRQYTYMRKLVAGCFQCNGTDGIWSADNAQGVAARHHDATGHQTWVDVYMSLRYGTEKEEGDDD